MRRVIGGSKRDPLSRLLAGTADALRARQQLPARDPRRASSRWLRPNWPDALLLTVHRRRLVEALMRDEALRQEVRDRLRLPAVTALGSDLAGPGSGDRAPAEVAELLAAAIAAADDPVAVLESAATDPDPVVAGAAAPYLNGELSLPAANPGPQALAVSRHPARQTRTRSCAAGRTRPRTPRSPCAGSCGTSRRRPRSCGASSLPHGAGRARGGNCRRPAAPGPLPPRARGAGFCFVSVRQGR